MTNRDERMGEIRGLVAKEEAGESVSDRYSSARLLDATTWLLSEVDRLREALHEVWVEIDFGGERDELTGLTKINLTDNEVELIRRALHGEEDA